MAVRKLLCSKSFAADTTNIVDALEEAIIYIKQQQIKKKDYTVIGIAVSYFFDGGPRVELIVTGE